jgi:hypothetical protein
LGGCDNGKDGTAVRKNCHAEFFYWPVGANLRKTGLEPETATLARGY